MTYSISERRLLKLERADSLTQDEIRHLRNGYDLEGLIHAIFERFGIEAIFARNRELAADLRERLIDAGWPPMDLSPTNRSTIVAVPLGDKDPASLVERLLAANVICRARDGNLRLSVHFYNNSDDMDRLVAALQGL